MPAFYKTRGLPCAAVPRTVGWRVAQDLSSRLGIAAGRMRPPDYRDDVSALIPRGDPVAISLEVVNLDTDLAIHLA